MQLGPTFSKYLRRTLQIPGKGFYKNASKVLLDAIGDDVFTNESASLIYTADTKRGPIKFYCIGEIPLRRAKRALTKEPGTIAWVDTFGENDVLWDIGANVGVYSLYAAINGKIKVLAFEPYSPNYFLLQKNVELNHLDQNMSAFCIALAEKTFIDHLNVQNTDFGAAGSAFATDVDHAGTKFVPTFRQGVLGYSMDDFVRLFDPPFPNHIKIDVDGNEGKIIQGASETLRDSRLKSLLIELKEDRDDRKMIQTKLESLGFRVAEKFVVEESGTDASTYTYNNVFRRD
jgi:FkbM family methyltransferase